MCKPEKFSKPLRKTMKGLFKYRHHAENLSRIRSALRWLNYGPNHFFIGACERISNLRLSGMKEIYPREFKGLDCKHFRSIIKWNMLHFLVRMSVNGALSKYFCCFPAKTTRKSFLLTFTRSENVALKFRTKRSITTENSKRS